MPDKYPLSDPGDGWTNLPPEQKAALDALRDHLRAGHAHDSSYDQYYTDKEKQNMKIEDAPGIPHVPHPSSFQPDPFVIGSPLFARMVKRLIDLDPRTKEQANSVVRGPTRASIQQMVTSGLAPGTSGETTLMGITDKKPGSTYNQIGVQDTGPLDEFRAVVHELGHVAGYGHEQYGAPYGEQLVKDFSPTIKKNLQDEADWDLAQPRTGDIKLPAEPRDIKLEPDTVNAIIRALAAKGIKARIEK